MDKEVIEQIRTSFLKTKNKIEEIEEQLSKNPCKTKRVLLENELEYHKDALLVLSEQMILISKL